MTQKNKCFSCGKETRNKEFCSGVCRKRFNLYHYECSGLERSFRGRRA